MERTVPYNFLWLCVRNKTLWCGLWHIWRWSGCYTMHFFLYLQYRTARRLRLAAHPENTCFSNEERVCTIIILTSRTMFSKNGYSLVIYCRNCLLVFHKCCSRRQAAFKTSRQCRSPAPAAALTPKRFKQVLSWYIRVGVMIDIKMYVELYSRNVGKISFLWSSHEENLHCFNTKVTAGKVKHYFVINFWAALLSLCFNSCTQMSVLCTCGL